MTALKETTVGRLRSEDVGRRVVAVQAGVAFDGTLTDLSVSRTEYRFKDKPQITASLTVKVLEIVDNAFSQRDKVIAELIVRNLPLDYLIQVEESPDVAASSEGVDDE